ncbi:hypothetical protein HN865_01775 [Candidatus Woesearchaeota archaeon]|jgi:hypothetical protein|nr:hypothetical protein [Candidatus Woesearchaeota archaeon]
MINTLEHTVEDRMPEDLLKAVQNSKWKPRIPTPKEMEKSARAERTRIYSQPITFKYLFQDIVRYFK